jgi:hypothetical protein
MLVVMLVTADPLTRRELCGSTRNGLAEFGEES